MYYIYKIKLGNNEIYVGCTNNLRRRKDQHNENIRNRSSKFGDYVNRIYPNFQLELEDLVEVNRIKDRSQALQFEKQLTMQYEKDGFVMLNDNYTKNCSRKNKNLGNTSKEYYVIDIVSNTVEYVENLRQYSIKNNFAYKSLQDSIKKTHVYKGRYKAFHKSDWEAIENKSYYLSGKFLEDINKANKKKLINHNAKKYEVETPDGRLITVENLDQFARDKGINSGNLHNSYRSGKRCKGYIVIRRV